MYRNNLLSSCQCGQVKLELIGSPILAAACYCNSCKLAGEHFERHPEAPPVLDADGSSDYVLYRKDRVVFSRGREQLSEYKLSPQAPTRRVLATCCHTPMFLEFNKGHWLSLYKNRLLPDQRPALQMRVMLADRPDELKFNDNIPSFARHSGKFLWKLLWAWVAMGFRAPKIDLNPPGSKTS